mmetsp:Transcript_5229/g.22189  ORF Transcript_5229/g.22189 Transcript_5229/m.22189 type:complete len:243 (+) Transcript_5229:2685-3413(+)
MASDPRRRRRFIADIASTALANRVAGRLRIAPARSTSRIFFQFSEAFVVEGKPSSSASAATAETYASAGTTLGAPPFSTAPCLGSKYTSAHVTSSDRVSSAAQCAYAVATISCAAASGPSARRRRATASTSSLVMNSNTPSEARIRHRVRASSWYVNSSGRAQTPSFFPVASPSERVNAHPGNVAPFLNTRGGSSAASMLSSPKSSLIGVSPRIMPSVANITGSTASFFMRSRSSLRKHVWS